jgi:hypothetical protein
VCFLAYYAPMIGLIVALSAMARAVLPTPPGPVSVVNGADAMLSETLQSSASRPINRRGRNTGRLGFNTEPTKVQTLPVCPMLGDLSCRNT